MNKDMIDFHIEHAEIYVGALLGELEGNENITEEEYRKYEVLYNKFLDQMRLAKNLLPDEENTYEPIDKV
ncbi:hypothetical protein CHH57_02235 [Niallia circulans]|uniref:Uncharacterized protein n=1 Tax=Niallia circulans TaxID=1397 RepID=A0AA91TVN1_NIACI|nr:hypothetical protein [Niallia circulans]PAD84870.1 hypothetical protein CHH57_02235 [Niallia circulans]